MMWKVFPVQMAVRKPSSPTLPLVVCSGDGKSGAHTTLQTENCERNRIILRSHNKHTMTIKFSDFYNKICSEAFGVRVTVHNRRMFRKGAGE